MYGEQDKEKKPQSDVMVDREKLKDLEVKKRMATLQAKDCKRPRNSCERNSTSNKQKTKKR